MQKDDDSNEETYCSSCMEVAGIESCGLGYEPERISYQEQSTHQQSER